MNSDDRQVPAAARAGTGQSPALDLSRQRASLIAHRWPELNGALQVAERSLPSVADQLYHLLDALEEQSWRPDAQFPIFRELLKAPERLDTPDLAAVIQWVRFHDTDDVDAVLDCIRLQPPAEVTVIGRLPRRGSQKIVFRANWKLHHRTVVLKKLLDPGHVLSSELHSHPLSTEHPNIIRTYTATNDAGEKFLIEPYLDEVLRDTRRMDGAEQTALLLHDIGSALSYIDRVELVHGDVKPDNIGLHQGRFILLDFGICRHRDQFTAATPATGSLRTRAPELMLGTHPQSIMSDVWALGAVICCAYCGTFPLVEPGEPIPRGSDPKAREQYTELLRVRASSEYEGRVTRVLDNCRDARLRELLAEMLGTAPKRRPTPEEVVGAVREHFPHAIPETTGPTAVGLSPLEEARLLCAAWPDPGDLHRLPTSRLVQLLGYLRTLEIKLSGAPGDWHQRIGTMLERCEFLLRPSGERS